MKTATITFKTTLETKRGAKKVADSFGIGLSAMINILLNKVIQTKTIDTTFHNNDGDLEPSDWLVKELEQADEDIKAGRVISFKSPQDAIAHVDKMIASAKKK